MVEHVQHVPADKKDRERFSKQWREGRDHKEKIKNERFAAMREKRESNSPNKNRDSINIKITGE